VGAISNESQRFWQVEFGFGLGNWVTTKAPVKLKWLLSVLAQSILPVLALLIVVFNVTPLVLLIPLGLAFILATIGFLSDPNSPWTSWIYHFQWFLNLHETLGVNILGGKSLPPEVYLSDGAHGDNMALLPLLSNQSYKKIIICDGTEDLTENCNNLIIALNLARLKLRCSFLTTNSTTDIEEEIKRFADTPEAACLKFQAIYHTDEGDLGNLSSSEIIYLKPRRGFAEQFTFRGDMHGCCCEFCHSKYCSFWDACCGTFPQHITMNQFFTQAQFEQYSLLGYRTSQCCLSTKEEEIRDLERDMASPHREQVLPLLAV